MITFPHKPFGAISTFTPFFRNVSGSPSLHGASQVVSSGAGLWQATVANIIIRDRETHLLWRALEGLVEGKANPVLVTVCEGLRQPYPVGEKPGQPVPFSDGAFFSDGSGFYAPVISATIAANVARGTVLAQITVAHGGELEAGQYFSVGERLYRIKSVESVSGTTTTVKFWPPAREAMAAGAVVEFDRPVCKMRLKTDDAMAIDPDLNRFTKTTLAFVEDLS